MNPDKVNPTVGEFTALVAKLGGSMLWKGKFGVESLWKGYRDLELLKQAYDAFT